MTLFDPNTQTDDHVDEDKDYLAELVGDDKKFKDVKALARGKYEADRTVAAREQELKELRDQYLNVINENKQRASLEELRDQILKQTSSSTQTTNANDTQTNQTFDPSQLEERFKSIFKSGISEWELAKRQEDNYKTVETKAREAYGNNFGIVLQQKARELNLTPEQAEDLARNRPELFVKAFGLDQRQQDTFQAPPRSSRETDRFAPHTPERTWTWYENLRKTKPSEYATPKIQKQMQDDIIRLGERFQDGDYKYL